MWGAISVAVPLACLRETDPGTAYAPKRSNEESREQSMWTQNTKAGGIRRTDMVA